MPTISDVAKQAGVSLGTVSRVINEAGNVMPGTREKVDRAIKELGYVPSASAQSLRSKRTRWLTMVVPTIRNPHWQALVRGVEDAAHSRNYAVFLGNTDNDPAKQKRYVDIAIGQNVAGVIVAPCNVDSGDLRVLRQRRIPTVLVNRRVQGWQTDGVYCDNASAAHALVAHLIGLGHRRIAMISDREHLSTMQERVSGYRTALAEAGLAFDPQLVEYVTMHSSGVQLADRLLDLHAPPTAIFTATDDLCIGAINALGRRGLRIPHDVALVTFGGHAWPEFQFLTHILEPAYELGMNAAQLLFSRLDGAEIREYRQVILPTRLVIRHSCGSQLRELGEATPSLLVANDDHAPSILIKPWDVNEPSTSAVDIPRRDREVESNGNQPPASDQPVANRLLTALGHEQSDGLPHLELLAMNESLYAHVLERDISWNTSASYGESPISPYDQIDFAKRLRIDAICCRFSLQPIPAGELAGSADQDLSAQILNSDTLSSYLRQLPSLAQQISRFERYIRAASGTGVGVAAGFDSFFAVPLASISSQNELLHSSDLLEHLDTLFDTLLTQQEALVNAICNRFFEDLAFVVVYDRIANANGLLLPAEDFSQIYTQRIRRMIAPARDYGKPVILLSPGRIDEAMPILSESGFDAVYVTDAEVDDLFALNKEWSDKLAIIGGFPVKLFQSRSRDEIEQAVNRHCMALSSQPGYVFGCSGALPDDLPPQNYLTMIESMHRYGMRR